MSEQEQPILNLTEQEKRAFSYLFSQADSDGLGVVTGERAVGFFERTSVPSNVLGEIWQLADTENRGLLTKPGFCMVLRLIGHYQQGRGPSGDLAFKSAPIPKFEGLQIPGVSGGPPSATSPTAGGFPPNALQPQNSGGPIRVPPLDPQKVAQYSGLFERSGAQNGMLDGATAKSIFERAGLPNETLGKIWMLSDREQRGALDQTEFIVAMHLLTSMKTRAMTGLPSSLPPGLYEAAARRGAPAPPANRQSMAPGAIPRQFTGGSGSGGPHRAQSPLARQGGGYGPPPPPLSQQGTGQNWLISQQEKAKFDQFFSTVDTQGQGVITGEQAVRFFSDSGLDEDTLASIWDLADINSEGQLNRDEFAVAMYLIRQQRAPNATPLPAFLPPALVPPSMRKQNIQQQTAQTTAPAFDNAANNSNMNKSATEDLFGLDEPSQTQQQQQPAAHLQTQGTGASAISRDPFSGSHTASPSSPQRFQAQQPQQGGSMFKPFQPTSAFGASLASQNTGGSARELHQQNPGFQQQQQSQPQQNQQPTQGANAMDDLLGDNETNAAESSKITNETTELANMSNQIGNLRGQMEQTQAKKTSTQQDLNTTSTQKRDLELRLEQFRTQYEQEIRTVKELETQLASSRESTRKLNQELAMLEGSYQDLQNQHNTVAQALQADQQENSNLKQRISQLNAETSQLKPQLEKMKLDARQQKGMVSINKKQLSTNESELERLQREKADLEREAAEREEQARNAPAPEAASSNVVSPAASTMSNTNPFFRNNAGGQIDGATSPTSAMSSAPTPSAFDALFGPAFAGTKQADSRSGTPPATSFVGRSIPPAHGTAAGVAAGGAAAMAGGAALAASSGTGPSGSSDGRPTPSVTPPLSEQAKEDPMSSEPPPPPPEGREFSASQLPLRGYGDSSRTGSAAGSTAVFPPSSRAGGLETPREDAGSLPISPQPAGGPTSIPGAFGQQQTTEQAEHELPGAFPDESAPTTQQPTPAANDDFDSAFAGFGEDSKAKDANGSAEDPFAVRADDQVPNSKGHSSEFPPIQSLEKDDDSESDDDTNRGFDDSFASASEQFNGTAVTSYGAAGMTPTAGPHIATGDEIARARPGVQSIESTASDLPAITSQKSPPTYDQSTVAAQGVPGQQRSESNSFPHEYDGLLPERDDPTSPPPPATSPPVNEQPAAQAPREESGPSALQTEPPLSATGTAATSGTSDSFHDASSRPMSTATDGTAPAQQQQRTATATAPQNTSDGFDDFDDFNDLAEAKEADKDLDFGFGGPPREGADEFNPAFDSPAPSTTNTMASTAPSRTVQADSSPFGNNNSSSSPFGSFNANSLQQTPQTSQNDDWDAIFSGLDSSKTDNIDTSFGNTSFGNNNNNNNNISAKSPSAADPWGTPLTQTPSAPHHIAQDEADAISPAPPRQPGFNNAKPLPPAQLPQQSPPPQQPRTFNPPPGPPPSDQEQRAPSLAQQTSLGGDGNGALSPGTEHDDPILKRLTGMGYPRNQALEALEKFDYDINMAVDHLTK